jgi:hypothetical protein
VVIISDSSCVPGPQKELCGFRIECVEQFPSKLVSATMTVYVREMLVGKFAT